MTLLWNNKKLLLNFKEFKKGFDEATVYDLKEKCKLITDVPIASMNLQVSGGKYRLLYFSSVKTNVLKANIKDNTATLTSVGIRANSVINLNGEVINVRRKVTNNLGGKRKRVCLG